MLGKVAPGEQGKDFELVAQRLTDMAGQDPDKAMQVLAVMYRMNLLQQTQQNFVPVLVAGTVLLGALATSLAATQLPPERQAEMQTAVSSAIDSIEKNVRDVNQRAEMVKLIVDVALANLGLPIHVLDPRLKKYEGLLVEAGKQNPSSGGYAEGGQTATTPHTGGSQLDGQQGGNVYVTPGHQLNPGEVYNESSNADSAKGIQKVPGFGEVDDFFASQSTNLNKKLGAKIGEGRLPYEASRTGVEQAKATVKETLENASSVSPVIPSSTVRGNYDLIHVYSSKTNSTVSLRVLPDGKYEFDTLIPEKSSKF